jgi:hypothetical protein
MNTVNLAKLKIGSLFLYNPQLKPQHAKPEESDYTEAKIMYFYSHDPANVDIHERHKQVGLSEGVVAFFSEFSQGEPVEVISTLNFTHVIKEMEPDIWLSMVIIHPDKLYSYQSAAEACRDETIANQEFQISHFREEDSRVFHKLLDVWYNLFYLFHGEIGPLFESNRPVFSHICDDFTANFDSYFFIADFRRNLIWNLNFQGFFYSPIEQKAFLETQLAVNSLQDQFVDDIAHVSLFYDEYFISSTLSHKQTLPIYQYLVGFADCQKEFRKDKVFTFKAFGQSVRIYN